MEKYTCPECNEEQTNILQSKTASIISKINLETQEMTEYDTVLGDVENYICPNCHENLSSICEICFSFQDDDGRCGCTNKN